MHSVVLLCLLFAAMASDAKAPPRRMVEVVEDDAESISLSAFTGTSALPVALPVTRTAGAGAAAAAGSPAAAVAATAPGAPPAATADSAPASSPRAASLLAAASVGLKLAHPFG